MAPILCWLCIAITITCIYGLKSTKPSSIGTMKTTQEIYDQTLDHFNAYNQATFKQRWFYNDTYRYGADKSFIFEVGG